MAPEALIDKFNTLTPEEQESVWQFLEFLKHRRASPSPFLKAVDEFIDEHPELLRSIR